MHSYCLKQFHWNIMKHISCYGFCNSQNQTLGHPAWSRCFFSSMRYIHLPFCCSNRLTCTDQRFPITAIVFATSDFYLKTWLCATSSTFCLNFCLSVHSLYSSSKSRYPKKWPFLLSWGQEGQSDMKLVGKTKATFINMGVFWEARDCLCGVYSVHSISLVTGHDY